MKLIGAGIIMNKNIVLTGISTTGTPHLGNYVGAIRPAIEACKAGGSLYFYFLADYHAIVKCHDPEIIKKSSVDVAATWIALGLDLKNAIFYRQSDIPEILELTWILLCFAAKGLMNRAHAYKAAVANNERIKENDSDKGINMGLYCYPILMAADILLFKANKIPVGKDQIQHIEMARDIAKRFNHKYGEHFVLPKAVVDQDSDVLSGLDGRKMSKSYNNTIPLFSHPDKLRKLIMKIETNSLPPNAPKDSKDCTLFSIYQAFANEKEIELMKNRYSEGIGWGVMKQELFELINDQLENSRQNYMELLKHKDYIEKIIQDGGDKARAYSEPFLKEIKKAIGIL